MQLGTSGCDPLCLAKGTLKAPEAPPDARCSVKLHHDTSEPERYGSLCRPPDTAEGDRDRWVIHPGESFQCMTIPGLKGQNLDVTASCPGFDVVHSPAFEWRLKGFTCEGVDVGLITVKGR
jgi:hypothetical protein